MFLENLVFDAVDPHTLGSFWANALKLEVLTDTENAFEARLNIAEGPSLDLCFQPVPQAPSEPVRVHLDLYGGRQQAAVVDSMLSLGARKGAVGHGHTVPWTVMEDPEGNPFCVMESRPAYQHTGPIAAVPLQSHHPDRAAEFWAALTGWSDFDGVAPRSLRHPSGVGPLIEFCPEPFAKHDDAKNRMHLDIRLEPDDDMDAAAAMISDLGGSEFDAGWGNLPWRTFRDPSGNEFCVLPAL